MLELRNFKPLTLTNMGCNSSAKDFVSNPEENCLSSALPRIGSAPVRRRALSGCTLQFIMNTCQIWWSGASSPWAEDLILSQVSGYPENLYRYWELVCMECTLAGGRPGWPNSDPFPSSKICIQLRMNLATGNVQNINDNKSLFCLIYLISLESSTAS